jgi:hypothetical protein
LRAYESAVSQWKEIGKMGDSRIRPEPGPL